LVAQNVVDIIWVISVLAAGIFISLLTRIFAKALIEKERARKRLIESEKELSHALKIARAGYWEYDVIENKINWSDQIFTLYERDISLGQPTPEEEAGYYAAEDAKRFRDTALRVIESGEKIEGYDFRANLPSGRPAFFTASMHPVKNETGVVVKLVGFVQDITERKQAEEALREKTVEMDSFINNIPDMAWLRDNDSNFIIANKAFCDAVGMTPEYIATHTSEICFGKETSLKFKEDDKRVVEAAVQIVFEESITDVNGNKVVFETIMSPIFGKSGQVIGTVGIARDITVRKKLELALQEKNVALRELLSQLEKEKKAIEDRLVSNSELLLLPLIEKMKTKGSKIDDIYLDLIESTIKNLNSSFAPSLEKGKQKLTAREMEVCNMIKNGFTTKEIAQALDIAIRTVDYHRKNIRNKLHIKGKDINLPTYLQSL